MKKLIALSLSVFFSLNVFAVTEPDFVCVEESGFMYEFYLSSYGEIHIYTDTGEELDHLDGISYTVQFFETYPAQTRYDVFDGEDKTEIANITFIDGEADGFGEMVDHDQTMFCF